MTWCFYQVRWNTKFILKTHLCSYRLWNNHICPKLQTLKSFSFLYSSFSYGYVFLILILGIAPTTHKLIKFFLFDVGIAWFAHKSKWYLVAWCKYYMNHQPTHISFLMQVSHDSPTNPNNILWFQRKYCNIDLSFIT